MERQNTITQKLNKLKKFIKTSGFALATVLGATVFLSACQSQGRNASGFSTADALPAVPSTSSTPTASSTSHGPLAVQVMMNTGSTGSFDSSSVPASGGTYSYASRFYDLKGNLISSSQYSSWWLKATAGVGVFLTSTSTSYNGGGSGATTSTSGKNHLTPCAYFDNYSDNNPESNGYYTIDGLVPNAVSLSDSPAVADVDQCAGVTNTEKSKLGVFLTVNRSNMDSTDKLQIIIKAKPLNQPNSAPVPSSCIVGGLFDATACSNGVFNITMRTALAAAARPFYMLFPSAKSLDLISESVLLPINADSTITTISIDRLKGGAVFYSIILVRVP